MTYDDVSSPEHYVAGRIYEPRKVIEDWGLNFNLGNVVKYVSRAGRKKDILEDLKKARQYLDFEIERVSNNDDCFEKPSSKEANRKRSYQYTSMSELDALALDILRPFMCCNSTDSWFNHKTEGG